MSVERVWLVRRSHFRVIFERELIDGKLMRTLIVVLHGRGVSLDWGRRDDR